MGRLRGAGGLGGYHWRRVVLIQRGEVRLVDLDPVRGSEANKRRPAIVVSNDHANAVAARLGQGVVTVVPLTSNVNRVFPFQVLLPAKMAGLRVESKAQAEQVRSVAVERLGPVLGRLPASTMAAVEGALRLHLDL
jgi:mRNA interferase MazF